MMVPLESSQIDSALDIDEIHQKIDNLNGLPPFPAIATRILGECEKDDVDVAKVINLIECEPVIGGKVLQMANSPLYGATRPIKTIGHAFVLLGYKAISQMAVVIAAGAVFDQGDPRMSLHRRKTFKQSLACASTVRLVASFLGKSNPDEAFLCGVMHDVGKLVLMDAAPQAYGQILENPIEEHVQMEFELFGSDHPSVGQRCGTKWGLPAGINLAIKNHHFELDKIEDELSQMVVLANYFARRWQIGYDVSEVIQANAKFESRFNAGGLSSLQQECADQFEALLEVCMV